MKLKRIIGMGLLLLIVLPGLAFADIGENFAQSSVYVGGSGNMYWDLEYIFDSTWEGRYFRLGLFPEIGVFVQDDIATSFVVGMEFENDRTDANNQGRDLDATVQAYLDYYSVMDPMAEIGVVPSFGAGIAFWYDFSMNDLVGGTDVKDSSSLTASLILSGKVNYFVTDRAAVYLDLRPSIDFLLSAKDGAGNKIDFDFGDEITVDVGLYFGVSYFIPSSKRVALQ